MLNSELRSLTKRIGVGSRYIYLIHIFDDFTWKTVDPDLNTF